jgi:hypothetical protein
VTHRKVNPNVSAAMHTGTPAKTASLGPPHGHTQKRSVARGCRKHRQHGRLGIVCYLDEDTFFAIRKRAVKEHTSFGEQVRILLEWGLEEAEKA